MPQYQYIRVEIPYSIEQGIYRAELGILNVYQGNLASVQGTGGRRSESPEMSGFRLRCRPRLPQYEWSSRAIPLVNRSWSENGDQRGLLAFFRGIGAE